MAALEKRYPRESFTKKLVRMCERLDETCERSVTYKYFYQEATCQVEITSVWVVGSYARGALACGDLDMVLECRSLKGGLPLPRVLAKDFFGTLPLVRYYTGTPSENTSGVPFAEAVQIWSGAGCDWKSLIESILPDPNAGRAARETDSIPLRDEQLRTYGSEIHDAADMQRDGLLEWEFVEIDEGMLSPIPDEEIEPKEGRLIRIAGQMGTKSRQLVPALLRLMRDREPNASWRSDHSNKVMLRCGGTFIHIGLPSLALGYLDTDPTIRQLALIPHLSARGPNGAWLIRRGPEHPYVKALANRHAFYLGCTGDPDIIQGGNGAFAAKIIELFDSEDAAKENAILWADNDLEPLKVAHARGAELVSLLSRGDVVEIGDHHLALTYRGASYLETDRASVADLIAALPVVEQESETEPV